MYAHSVRGLAAKEMINVMTHKAFHVSASHVFHASYSLKES